MAKIMFYDEWWATKGYGDPVDESGFSEEAHRMIVVWILLALFGLIAGFYVAAFGGLFLASVIVTFSDWRARRRVIRSMLNDMERVEWIVAEWRRQGRRGK